jgi:predicted DNA-binding transcriptional regulator YafY
VINTRGDRLLSILLLLQNRGKLTTNELAKERTIHRDMVALSTAGIHILAERGKFGGWRLLEQYRTNLTGLKDNEIKSLFISPSLQLLNRADGGRTGTYTKAGEELTTNKKGNSYISYADFAIAIADEVEQASVLKGRFSVVGDEL